MSIDVILNSPVVQALGLALFHSIWQAVVVFCIMQILLFWVKQPANRYRIQYGGLVIIFIAFSVSFFEQLSVADTSINMLAAAPVLDDNLGVQLPLQQASIPWWQPMVSMHHSPIFLRALPFITIGYGLGILLLTFRTMLSFDRIFKLRRKLLPVPASLQHEVFHLRNLLRIKKQVGIYLSHTINVPVMLGYLKPMIVLPVALINQLDKQQVEAILLHELAHIRRQDYLFNVLQIVMETLLFFNPIVWWLSAAIRKERELACDDYALKYIGTPLKYAQALFALEEARTHNLVAAMAATGNNKKHLLFNRIKRITDMKNNTRKNPQGIAVALTALMITVAMVGFFVAGAQDVPKDKKEQDPKVSSYSKSTVIVKDEDGKIHKYENETSSDEDATQAVEEAMTTAQSVLSQLDEQQIENYTSTAIEVLNSNDMKQALAAAKEELKKVDWNEVSKSLKDNLGSMQEIDWEALSRGLNKGLESVEGINDKEIKKALQEVKRAIEDAKNSSGKKGVNSTLPDDMQRNAMVLLQESKTKIAKQRKVQQDHFREIMEEAQQRYESAQQEHRKEMEEHRVAMKSHKKSVKEHEKALLTAEENTKQVDALLENLKKNNLISDLSNINVRLTNEALYIDDKKQSDAAFKTVKKFVPQGNNSTMTIMRTTKSN